MSGYGIAGLDREAARVLEAQGWKRRADGFCVLEPGSLEGLLRAVRALEDCPLPPECRLFTLGESVDLAALKANAPASSSPAAPAAAPSPAPAPVADPSPFPAAGFGLPGFAAAAQAPAPAGGYPSDPLSAMLAGGLFDDEEDDACDPADFPSVQAAVAASEPASEADASQAEPAEEEAYEEDEYDLDMMKIFGLR